MTPGRKPRPTHPTPGPTTSALRGYGQGGPGLRFGWDEVRALGAFRDLRGELQGQCGHAPCPLDIDLFPVVRRPVIVTVEAGEEVDGRHPAVDERRVVAASSPRP